MEEVKIGVYICHCGVNIAATVDCEELARYAGTLDSVVLSRDYIFVCSDPGQELIRKDIKEYNLNRVIVASCSPRLHEPTFRRVCESAGLNPYLFEMVNIREHCSWVNEDRRANTEKAKALVKAAVRRVSYHEPLEVKEVPYNPNTLVVGGGIAGIQAALEIANSEHKVYLVEREPSIGGHMIQLDKTFPTLDCSQCILTPKMSEVGSHPHIELLAYSEVEEVSGYIGNFTVKIRKKARYVDENKCTGCNVCVEGCPIRMDSEFELGLTKRKAIYIPFPQAVPNVATIDKREKRPCNAACKDACPVHMNVQGYLALIGDERFEEAYELIRRTNPLPAICGRVCYAPCEEACNRSQLDEPLAIAALKRFVTDQIDIEKLTVPKITKNGKKVAIVGSGPGGLAAAHDLALLGYDVTVFEALPEPGGTMQVGIPEDRLPKEVLGKEISYIERLGVEIKTNRRIESFGPLFEEGFYAILVAVGAYQGLRRSQIVAAISGKPDLPKQFGLSTERVEGGIAIKVDENLMTSRQGVFAAGDAIRGPTSVIDAIASGKRAARSIDRYLKGEPLVAEEERKVPKRVSEEEVSTLKARFPYHEQVKMKGGIEQGYTIEEAKSEAERCLALQIEGCFECGECEERCDAKAINYQMQYKIIEIEVGSIILATGYNLMDAKLISQYGYGKYDNVITGLEFERIVSPTGPTGGKIRLKDGREPESVAIIHCVGSRDKNYHEYCSRVCCMYALKQANYIKEELPNTDVYQLYIDMRSFGDGYEEFYERLSSEGVNFIRGKVAKVTDQAISDEEKGKLIVVAEDTLLGSMIRIPVDMVILCNALEPQADAGEVASRFTIGRKATGFFLERHPKLDPVATPTEGIFVAGCCQSPKDIPDTVAQASAAATRVLAMISKGKVAIEAAISVIDEERCSGCKTCLNLCPFSAVSFDEEKRVCQINEALCKGCGVCGAACPSGAITAKQFTNDEIMAQVEGVLA